MAEIPVRCKGENQHRQKEEQKTNRKAALQNTQQETKDYPAIRNVFEENLKYCQSDTRTCDFHSLLNSTVFLCSKQNIAKTHAAYLKQHNN